MKFCRLSSFFLTTTFLISQGSLFAQNRAARVIDDGHRLVRTGNRHRAARDLRMDRMGAVAKNANIQFVTSASTNSSDGITLSAQYIVKHNLAPVMTLSFAQSREPGAL